jgi:hypothetical protein
MGSLSDQAEELCVRLTFCPELQLGIVVGKISGFRNCLRTAPYTARWGILSGKQDFRRTDFGSRLLAAEGEGGGDSESEGPEGRCG